MKAALDFIGRSETGVALLVLASLACGSADPPPEPSWQVVQSGLPGGLLRVWGRSARDIYAVGADGDGAGSLVLHFDGRAWRRLDPGTRGDLWWVDGVGDDDIRMVGEAGLILRYRPSTGAFERLEAPEAITLFGVWGSSSGDVWYAGGDISRGRGILWRDDGRSIRSTSEVITATGTAALFKVHGFAEGGVWFVGQLGRTAFWNGSSFVEPRSGTALPLFTVHGLRASRVYAVGGVADGVILAWDGSEWMDETPREAPQLNAIWVVRDDLAYAAGFNGRIFRRDAAGWSEIADDIPTFQDLHSVWVDENGEIWASGGRLASDPPKDGVLIHYGVPIPTEMQRE